MTALEDDDDLYELEQDEVDEEAEEYELGSTLPSDVGYFDPYDPMNVASDVADDPSEADDDDQDDDDEEEL